MSSITRGAAAGIRLVHTRPGLALASIGALAIGIGFTTTMFGIVHGATRSLPLQEPDEIVAVQKTGGRGSSDAGIRPFDYRAWAAAARGFEGLGAFEAEAAHLAGDGGTPARAAGAAVTSNVFALAGVAPASGRTLLESDMAPGAPPVVVIGHTLWQGRYGADPAIVGRTVRIHGRVHTIVGVMPPRFGFPVNAELWTPLPLAATPDLPATGPRIGVFGRLRDGVSIEMARAEIETITSALARHHPATHAGIGIEVIPFSETETPREIVRALYLLVLAASFVLIIACVNVANLLLARAAGRAREVAVMLALGASRRDVLLEHLGETAVMATIAAALGLLLAHAGTSVFATETAHILEAFWVDIRVDPLVALVAVALAALAMAAAGAMPALRASRTNIVDGLKARGPAVGARVGPAGHAFVAVQVALACGLLALTTVLARTAFELRTVEWPFDPRAILTADIGIGEEALAEPAARVRLIDRLLEALHAMSGVERAALASTLPGRGAGNPGFSLDTLPEAGTRRPTTGVAFVTEGFFDVLDARLIAGRRLTRADDEDAAPVAVVNESFVRRFSADRDPIGRRLFLGTRPLTIVGVVEDLVARDVQDRRQDGIYVSMRQVRTYGFRAILKTAGPPLQAVPGLRAALATVDPDMPVFEILTLHEAVYRDKRVLDVLSLMFLVFGAGALLLTAIGLSGIVSLTVSARLHEIGVRTALGASRAHVAGLVVRHGAWQVLAGLAMGIGLALVLTRAFAGAVEGIRPADAPLIGGLAGSVATMAAAALAGPVRRAIRVDIARALRHD